MWVRSKNLRSRVGSYFSGIEGHPAHTRKLVDSICNVRWQTTRTELEAMLLESRLIKQHRPRFNRASLEYRHRPSLRLGRIRGAPWLTVIHYVRNDGAEYYGPFASRRAAETIVEILVRLYGASPSSFRMPDRLAGIGLTAARIGGRLTDSGYSQARAFLRGDCDTALSKLQSRMQAASKARKFELAKKYRDWGEFLQLFPVKSPFGDRSILERNGAAILVLGVRAEVHLFAFGCPMRTLLLPGDAPRLDEHLKEVFKRAGDPPDRLPVEHIDEMALLSHWLRLVADRVEMVWHKTGMEGDALKEGILSCMDQQRQNVRDNAG